MDISYADPTIAERRRHFSPRAAVFAAIWLAAVILPPFLYVNPVRVLYREFKVELPTFTRWVLDFQSWNEQLGWVWIGVPILAGVLAARSGRDDTDAYSVLHRRQELLYNGMLLTLAAMLITVMQMAVIWMPWMCAMCSVAGGGVKK